MSLDDDAAIPIMRAKRPTWEGDLALLRQSIHQQGQLLGVMHAVLHRLEEQQLLHFEQLSASLEALREKLGE